MTKDEATEIFDVARMWADAAVRYSGAPQQEQEFLALLNSMIDDTQMNQTEMRADEDAANEFATYAAEIAADAAKYAKTAFNFSIYAAKSDSKSAANYAHLAADSAATAARFAQYAANGAAAQCAAAYIAKNSE